MSHIAIATTTYYQYKDKEKNTRLNLACGLISNAVAAGYPIIVVDASPTFLPRDTFSLLGVKVIQQTDSGMDGSRRQVFRAAEDLHELSAHSDGITVWTEPEKGHIIKYILSIIAPIQEGRAHIVIAGRTDASWDTYPRFQIESEKTANAVYQHVTGINADVMFGLAAFSREVAHFFTQCNPRSYGVNTGYIQHVAPLLAVACGFKVECVKVDFKYPPQQREEEETEQSMNMVTNRLWQMRQLVESYIALSKILCLPR